MIHFATLQIPAQPWSPTLLCKAQGSTNQAVDHGVAAIAAGRHFGGRCAQGSLQRRVRDPMAEAFKAPFYPSRPEIPVWRPLAVGNSCIEIRKAGDTSMIRRIVETTTSFISTLNLWQVTSRAMILDYFNVSTAWSRGGEDGHEEHAPKTIRYNSAQ